MIRSEDKRLRSVFRVLLLAISAPAGMQGCTDSSSAAPAGSDGGQDVELDATTARDAGHAGTGADARAEAGGEPKDASSDVPIDCHRSEPYFIDAANVILNGQNCFYFVDLPCGSKYLIDTDVDCFLPQNECATVCTLDATFYECQYWKGCAEDGAVAAGQPSQIACVVCSSVGRRPAGLVRSSPRRAVRTCGEYLAQASELEAASVMAFEHLRDELRWLGAPRDLVRMAGRSARDEALHAAMTARLARRYQGAPSPVRATRPGKRSLEQVARENAVEGCVRETFGALVASWQATHAADARVRRSMARIAADETRHAALAWAVAGWAETRLDRAARARVSRARRAAVHALGRELGGELPLAVIERLGLPRRRQAQALFAGMSAHVWDLRARGHGGATSSG